MVPLGLGHSHRQGSGRGWLGAQGCLGRSWSSRGHTWWQGPEVLVEGPTVRYKATLLACGGAVPTRPHGRNASRL